MRYTYMCEETKEEIEREFPITKDIPAEVEFEGKMYRRKWAGHGGIRIPRGWADNKIKFTKSPSRKKHFY